MSTSATLTTFRFKSFNCRTTENFLIQIKYMKNENHLGIVQDKERTRKTSQQTSRRIHLENLVGN